MDYEELAAALLAQVTRLAATPADVSESSSWARRRLEQLEARNASLQRDVARANAEAEAVAAERDILKNQLEAAEHNLSLLTDRLQEPRRPHQGAGRRASRSRRADAARSASSSPPAEGDDVRTSDLSTPSRGSDSLRRRPAPRCSSPQGREVRRLCQDVGAERRGTSKVTVPNVEIRPPVDPRTSLRTRREVLVAGMAGAFTMALAACGGETARKAAAVAPAGSDLGAIEHVIFLMNENRSFDHYFGSYKGVRGFGDVPRRIPGPLRPGVAGGDGQQLLPFHLDTTNTAAECTFDLSHEWSAQHTCWNHGQMDQFRRHPHAAAVGGPAERRAHHGLLHPCRTSSSGTRSPTPSRSPTGTTAR